MKKSIALSLALAGMLVIGSPVAAMATPYTSTNETINPFKANETINPFKANETINPFKANETTNPFTAN